MNSLNAFWKCHANEILVDRWKEGWKDGWMDGWMDGWINTWTNGWYLVIISWEIIRLHGILWDNTETLGRQCVL